MMLSMFAWARTRRLTILKHSDPRSIAALFVYLLSFSYGYERINTGIGAIILFGTVQIVMYFVALQEGERLSIFSVIGLGLAATGLCVLVLPGQEAPDSIGALLMTISGVAWGGFCLLARGVKDPIEANAGNFFCCLPMVALVNLHEISAVHITAAGTGVAIFAGAIASGVGYVLWYLALDGLTATRAATVQLAVPAIAAIGGALVLDESLTLRFLTASILLLAGIVLVFLRRPRIRSAGASKDED